MYMYDSLLERGDKNDPVRVGLIGAGKFGSMFLSQVPTTPNLVVTCIADLDVERAKAQCAGVGWESSLIERIAFTESGEELVQRADVDVVVEATGDPLAGVQHALACIENGKHVIMVNVEADVLVGPVLAEKARQAGVVYSMAYGDQPALTVEMIEWARCCGFEVVAAGKGTMYLPEYHASTPDTIWSYYGLTAEQAAKAGMRSQMFNSFLDGTKSAIEMAAIANASGLEAPDGLSFPPCSVDDLAQVLRPRSVGGQLDQSGQVEVVSSLERDGSPVFRDLRWGVYCVFEAPNSYSADCFVQYGMNTDSTGRYSAMYKPFHLIGLELNVSILSAVLRGQPTGTPRFVKADVTAVAKRDLEPGESLDGEGGYTVWGKVMPAGKSRDTGALPIGLAANVTLNRKIEKGEVVTAADVDLDPGSNVLALREQMFAALDS